MIKCKRVCPFVEAVIHRTLAITSLSVAILHAPLSAATPLPLADTPLFLGAKVDPNVFFMLDDSGSMDWEILTPRHWHGCSYDSNFTGSFSGSQSCGFEVTNGLSRIYGNGTYRYLPYLYENNDNVYDDRCHSSSRNSAERCGSQLENQEWRLYSPALNATYFDPTLQYAPWRGACDGSGTPCGQANFTAARSAPHSHNSGYGILRNLTGSVVHLWVDDKGFDSSDGRPYRGSAINVTLEPNNEVDLWDSFVRLTLNGDEVDLTLVTHAPNSSGLNRTQTLLGTLSGNACYDILGRANAASDLIAGSTLFNAVNGYGCQTVASLHDNFANWYQYHRKRSFAAKGVVGEIINTFPAFRYGTSVLNRDDQLFEPMPSQLSSDYLSHNESLRQSLYRFQLGAYGTPLRRGLNDVGLYFKGNRQGHDSPILESCQQNFALLLTDGFWNGGTPSPSPGDADGDGYANTVADVALKYYSDDLSPLPDEVPTTPQDLARHQHMVTYTVAFGVAGNLSDTDGDGWPNPVLPSSGNWGNPFSSDTAKIDDLWHAAYNSRGTFVSAKTPQAVAEGLNDALNHIVNRVTSAASVAQNSAVLQTDSKVYQARFDSAHWTGQLLAYPLSLQGTIDGTPSWNAQCLLTGGTCYEPIMAASQNPGISYQNRVLITEDPDNPGTGVPFRYPNNLVSGAAIAPEWAALLSHAPHAVSSTDVSEQTAINAYGASLVNYLRGEQTQTQSQGGGFRDRQGLLGDIVHSDPLFVGPPNRIYPDAFETAPYSAFKQAQNNRSSVVYVGANDGYLHAFDANTGTPLLSYLPKHRALYAHLANLSTPGYAHAFGVDGAPNAGDVYVDFAWRTVLAFNARTGAQGVFLLDITEPEAFSEANADQIHFGSFTDETDADLGYGLTPPALVKLPMAGVNTWSVVFGNGLNATEADGHSSSNGAASLFIVPLESLSSTSSSLDYTKVVLPSGSVSTPNGLVGIYPVDLDGDFVVDYLYGTDHFGQVWRFAPSLNPMEPWTAVKLFESVTDTGLRQPITTAPVVGPGPKGNGVMVYFGTGQYLTTQDNSASGQLTQRFYAIHDTFSSTPITLSDLVAQSILAEVQEEGATTQVRQTSANPVDYTAEVSPDQGWYLTLALSGQNRGERVIHQPRLRNGHVIFNTLLPSDSPCAFGGSSWLMELNAFTGHPPIQPVLDRNEDQVFDASDYGTLNGVSFVPGGIQSQVGLTAQPAVILAPNKTTEYKILSGTQGLGSIAESGALGPYGRQTWRQLD